ncbi:MAG: hypothetical protein RID23_20175 [Roseovarius sp.]
MKCIRSTAVAACLACGLSLASVPAAAQEAVPYAAPDGWEISQLRQGEQVAACEALRITGSEEGLFFRHAPAETVIGFSSLASAASPYAFDVEMWFDGDRGAARSYAMQPISDHNGFVWRGLVLSNAEPWGELDLFADAATVHFAYDTGTGPTEVTFPLTGSSRAAEATYACVQTTASAATAPAPAPKVIRGSCKLVVEGQVYVDMASDCPIWLAGDGTGSFWINTDREHHLGDYFAQVEPDGRGGAAAWWNGSAGARHAQGFLGDDFRLGSGGCWLNAKAMVCAAK